VNDRITVPNILTASRIVMAVVAAFIAVRGHREVAVAVCIAAAWLDVFDGWYARTFSRCSSLGKHLDPLADKVLMGVVFTWLGLDAGSTIVWMLIALVGVREVGVTVLRAYSLRRHGRFIPASPLGRVKMLTQSVAGLTILSITYFLGFRVPVAVVAAAMVVILVVSYVSAAGYVRGWLASRGRAWGDAAQPIEEKIEDRRVSAGR
jgi:CDP-diacylglycerol---glycerol-3-phosphate 3-phosphatidyltransferase